MTQDQTIGERLRDLADRIAIEKDEEKFTALVKELNELLDERNPSKPGPESK